MRAKCPLPAYLFMTAYDVKGCVYRVFAGVIVRKRKNRLLWRPPEEGPQHEAMACHFPTSLTPTVSYFIYLGGYNDDYI